MQLWPRSWQDRRAWKLRIITLCFCLASALGVVAITHLHLPGLKAVDAKSTADKIKDRLGPLSPFFETEWLDDVLVRYPDLAAAIFGFFVVGGLLTATRRDWFHDRFIVSFNDDLLHPVKSLFIDRSEKAIDYIQLPWTVGDGPRAAAWNGLQSWCRLMAAPHSKQRLSVAVLVGRSGSGKSRLAHELARAMARRDVLGGALPTSKVGWRLGCYARRVLPYVGRRDCDPWDAGILQTREDDFNFEQLCARFEEWRPRRPTIILLDDPLVGWAGMARRALIAADAKRPFKHSVCLLVVNQTVPNELGFEFDSVSQRWLIDRAPAAPPPIALPIESWFSRKEAVHVAFETCLFADRYDAQKQIREHLFEVSSGNPLLVGIAIEHCKNGHAIAAMEPGDLLEARAWRIIDGLAHHGVKQHAQLLTLALATLVGGGQRSKVEAAVATIASSHVPLPDELRGCFPSEPLAVGAQAELPAVRPDLIADAFVACVLRKVGEENAPALAKAAFRIAPRRMLQTIGRIRQHSSPMKQAIIRVARDPAGIRDIDPVELAITLADMAVVCLCDDRPYSTVERRAELLEFAAEAVGRLDTGQRRTFCEALARLCEISPLETGQRQLRPVAALTLLDAATDPELAPPILVWTKIFKALQGRAEGSLTPLENLVSSAGRLADTLLIDEIATLIWDMGTPWRPALSELWHALAQAAAQQSEVAFAARLVAMAANARPEIARDAAKKVAEIATHYPDDPIIGLERAKTDRFEAYAWSRVAGGMEALAAQAAADRIAVLASRFPIDAEFALQEARARCHEAYAWSEIPSGDEAPRAQIAANIVADIAERFPDDHKTALAMAQSRCFEVKAWASVPDGAGASAASAAANAVAAIGTRFPNDLAITRRVSLARFDEASAWANVPIGAGISEVRTAAEATSAIAERFPDDHIIAFQSAQAWCQQAYVCNQVPWGAEATASQSAANKVAAIAAGYPDEFSIAYLEACARRFEGFAWCSVASGKEAGKAKDAADTVTAIASRFSGVPRIAVEVVLARSYEAHAWALVRDGAEALKARQAADLAAAVAACFPNESAVALGAAQARRCEAEAWRLVPSGARASTVRATADVVAETAMRFPEKSDLAYEAALSRVFEAVAWSDVPLGAEANAARRAADAASVIAARFPNDPVLAHEAAQARCAEAYGWGQVPFGGQAVASAAAADTVATIAVCFPDDLPIARQAARARRHEAFARCHVPLGADAAAVHTSANAAVAILARFPNDLVIAQDVARARRCEAFARSQVPLGAQAAIARNVAEEVTALATRFPTDPEIAHETAQIRVYEAYAWNEVPGKAQASAACAAADMVIAIGARFPDDAKIGHEVVTARAVAREAYGLARMFRAEPETTPQQTPVTES